MKFLFLLSTSCLCSIAMGNTKDTAMNTPHSNNLQMNPYDTSIFNNVSKKSPRKVITPIKPREDSSQLKQIENRKLLAILAEINDLDIISYNNLEAREKRELIYKDILSKISDPVQAARLIILTTYLEYPGDARTVGIDDQFLFGICMMKHFIEQEHFLEAMGLIKSAIRLDAGSAYMFEEVLWNARHIAGVRERYAKELLLWENGLLQHGNPRDKANLKSEMQERVDLATKLFLEGNQNRENIDEYFPELFLSKNELKLFYFNALDKLLDKPERASLRYIWKRGLLVKCIKSLELKAIKDEDILVLFKALRVGSVMLTGDIDVVEVLYSKLNFNVGYDLDYLKSKDLDNEERLALIQKWQDLYFKEVLKAGN